MRKELPNWIEKRYAMLWKGIADKQFDFDEAQKLLSSDKKAIVSIVLSEMRRAGWLTVETNNKDTRKRFYQLSPINEYIRMKVKDIEMLSK